MASFKITFVNAPAVDYGQSYGTLFPPLWAYTLAAHVPAPWRAEIVDCTLEDPDRIACADVFAFSGTNQDVDAIRSVHDRLRARFPDAIFIIGGPVTWSLEQEGKLDLLAFFDHLFILDGEQALPDFLRRVEEGTHAAVPKIVRAERFDLRQALPIRFDLYRSAAAHYSGAAIEVSRGCPFLCEFCDIRVLPGNNRANNKNVDLIIEEMDQCFAMGLRQFLFLCDNFIGDVAWARACVAAIVAWKARRHATISIFTWLTINLSKYPDLMADMRRAGFTILYVGIESVNHNSLLETAKIQNRVALAPAVRTIQSFGFIIAPGFIFGFDSDVPAVFDDTLSFIVDTGLIGGDPSFLTALPGTPLFERMRRSGRLVETEDQATARRKIVTNIRYLLDTDFLIAGFLRFIRAFTTAGTQLARFRNHVASLVDSKTFVPVAGVGSGSLRVYLRLQWSRAANRKMLFRRIMYFIANPAHLLALARAWVILKKASLLRPGLEVHFYFWVYFWSNLGLKYQGVDVRDFSLHAVGKDFDLSALAVSPVLARGDAKAAHQRRYTQEALRQLVADRGPSVATDGDKSR